MLSVLARTSQSRATKVRRRQLGLDPVAEAFRPAVANLPDEGEDLGASPASIRSPIRPVVISPMSGADRGLESR